MSTHWRGVQPMGQKVGDALSVPPKFHMYRISETSAIALSHNCPGDLIKPLSSQKKDENSEIRKIYFIFEPYLEYNRVMDLHSSSINYGFHFIELER